MNQAFIETCNRFNSILFSKIGATKAAEKLYEWGIRGGETDYELTVLANDYIDFIKS